MTGAPVAVRALQADDWPAVRAIYAEGIATGNATFESAPGDWERFDAQKLGVARVVAATADGTVVGWAAVSPTSTRPVYRGVVEHSVYVGDAARGQGVGRQLLEAMIDATEAAGIWTIQSSIFEENTASLALHDRLGFRVVGRRERIGRMSHGPWAGRWRDTILIERRSRTTPG
ncbi:phosphinothricin N-acetyltransferase [Microlunatus endophyticus]|uniref:Phosphinothricin N-acetyltransferase n=1 Tax=Microlunatus endophyticus TaxID=1716077 RepID=A0A917S905_9ACTN|nr:GNAT family N-acetyltransferase [Microlunatus endophyticus]GGL62110.1 phosphinothricin N-acetyltransferase [Microlunatus endophyticus]